MQKNAIKLTNHQLKLASDTDFPITKNQVFSQLTELFQELGRLQQQTHYHTPKPISTEYKITKGENYLLLPYLVIDYPRIANKDFGILMRTMFWWGKYFSFNLFVNNALIRSIDYNQLAKIPGSLIYKGSNLWEQDLDHPQYLSIENQSYSHETGYVKLSKKLTVESYEILIDEVVLYQEWLKAFDWA